MTKNSTPNPWAGLFNVAVPLIPLIVALLNSSWSLPDFSPRQPLYFNNIVPVLTAPWAASPTLPTAVSRIIQAAVLYGLPPPVTMYCYSLWMFIASERTLLGFILSRGVGWAYPRLFCHWAVYESSSGLGPALIAYLVLFGYSETVQFLRLKGREILFFVGICFLLSWLEDAPWTYAMSLICTTILYVPRKAYAGVHKRPPTHPMALHNHDDPTSSMKPRMFILTMILSSLALISPYLFSFSLSSPPRTSMSSSSASPLLDILVLSHPRPNITASSVLLTTTLSSYLPFLSSDVTLSAFTHSTTHTAFASAKDHFSKSHITFFTDADRHPDSENGQYLHAAEAFRWESERPMIHRAEWIMLVEDDFPICHGKDGWSAVQRVMTLLESERSETENLPERRAGFVGTGGSGLIIHRSLLPVLILLMKTHAETASKLPPNYPRRPADVVIQDCLLGVDPLCPRRPGGGSMVITSRLVMDHIGGMASTNPGKAGNSDKWRCGWRHPFHGRPEVEVIIV